MEKRTKFIRQGDATRIFRAARNAGYARARLITHPDGRIEFVAEDADNSAAPSEASPFEQWKAKNAR